MPTHSHRPGVRLLAMLCISLGVLLNATTQAQDGGSVAGVVISSWDGAALAGATVTVRGTTLAAQTDATGHFQLNGLPSGDQVLRFSKSGFAAAVVTDVRVIPGQTTTVNGTLRPEFYELEEYEVTAEEFQQQAEEIIFERQNSSAMMDAIGSERLSSLGVTDLAGALGKVTGASVAEGKFAVVRGLPDRYTSTTLNGGDIPSADPNRRAVQLDLFPSQFIGQLNVRKTFTPDMPGGFSGGAIDIVTKSFPEKGSFSFSAGASFNTQASLRDDFLITDHGSTDWLAMDDGTRALPPEVAATSPLGTGSPLNPAIKTSFASSQFAPVNGSSPLNSSFNLALGDTTTVLGHRVGLLGGLYYRQDYSYYGDGQTEKLPGTGEIEVKSDMKSVINYTWGAMAGLNFELLKNHEIALNYLNVATAEDEARRLQGQDTGAGTYPGESYLDQSILHWTERTLNSYQLKGTHLFENVNNIGLDWVGSMATTTQDEPDYRIFQFIATPGDPNDPNDDFNLANGATKPSRPTRIWRELSEDNRFFRGDLKIPLPSYNDKENLFKAGVSASLTERSYGSRTIEARQTSFNHPFTWNGDPNSYLASTNLGYIQYYNFPGSYVYEGRQKIDGYYGMGEWAALNWLQFIGGARLEQTDLSVVSDNLGTAAPPTNSAINQVDLLPSLGTVISLRSNMLLRASWSQTVVRPTYREIAQAEIYDTGLGRVYQGNPSLRMSSSENIDLRLEWYPRPGELISLSGFKKKITLPIEQHATDRFNEFIEYYNYGEADVQGFEFEIRKNLDDISDFTRELSLGFNYTYIRSEVARTDEEYNNQIETLGQSTRMRPMFEQPEFILNGDLTWDHKATATALTVSYGVVGRRLVIVGQAYPDEYEEAAPQLDVFLNQALGQHWKLKLSAKNLLDPTYETTQDWISRTVKVRSYTKGMTFGISLGCEF